MKYWVLFLFIFSPIGAHSDSSTDTDSGEDIESASPSAASTAATATQTDALLTMSREELLAQPQTAIDAETSLIQKALPADQAALRQYQALNTKYCALLTKISTQCVAAAYIGNDYGLGDLNCSATPPPPPVITVTLQNTGGNAFFLRANETYETPVFSAPTQTVLFSSADGQITTLPRFVDLTTLSIITVNGSKKDKKFPTTRPATLFVDIKVNGQSLLPPLPLLATPADASDISTYQISPAVIPTLRQQQGCYITAAEMTAVQSSTGP